MAANRAGPSSLVVAAWVLLEACHSSSSGGGNTTPPPAGGTVGLDARPSNLACVAPAKTVLGGTAIRLQGVFATVSLIQPLTVDAAGVAVLEQWIKSLATCQ